MSEWYERADEDGGDDIDGLLDDADVVDDDDDGISLDDADDFDDDALDDELNDDLLGVDTSDEDTPAPGGARRRDGGEGELGDVTVRLQASQAEVEAAKEVLDASPVPPLLRRRNAREGPIPLFGSQALRFRMPAEEAGADGGFESAPEGGADGLLTPLFFRRSDFGDAWAASGGAPEAMPAVQVTDLRTLAYQMQFDTTMDYRSMLLVAPEPAIEFVRQQQAAAQAAAEQTTELSAADVQGLIFGGGGPSRPKNDPRL